MSPARKTLRIVMLALLLTLLMERQAHAYIGPGAGFALAGSFFAVFAAIGSALLTFITWPVRLVTRTLFGWRASESSGQTRRDLGPRRHGLWAHRENARGRKAARTWPVSATVAASNRWEQPFRRFLPWLGRPFKLE